MYIFDKFKEINDSLGLFFIDNIYLRDTFDVIQRFSHSGLGLKSLLKREIINKLVEVVIPFYDENSKSYVYGYFAFLVVFVLSGISIYLGIHI